VDDNPAVTTPASPSDHDYDTRAAVPDVERYLQARAESSRRARERFRCRLDVPYGPSPDQRLDIFPSDVPDSPILVYVHGGAWRMHSKDAVSFLAETLVPAGVALVAPGFSLAPAVPVDEMVRQVREAVGWTYEHATTFGADPDRIHVAGHSSGAHLAAMVTGSGWPAESGLPAGVVKGACLTSGLYDLEPLRHTFMNEWLQLDAKSAERNSPVRHVPAVAGPLTIAVGGRETTAFVRQTADYVAAWRAAGHACRVIDMPEHHHYSLMLELGDPASPLLEALLAAIHGDRRRSPRST
jgi:arylformamidase